MSVVPLSATETLGMTMELVDEEIGFPIPVDMVCSEAGYCMIFYYRSYYNDTHVGLSSGLLVKVVKLSTTNEIQTLADSTPIPYEHAEYTGIGYPDLQLGLIQEDENTLRAIGWLEGQLIDCWWFNDNQTLNIHVKKGLYDYHYDTFDSNDMLFPRQYARMTEIEPYNLTGLIDSYTAITYNFLTTNGTTATLTPVSADKIDFWTTFVIDNESNVYVAEAEGNPNSTSSIIEIRKGNLNGTWGASTKINLDVSIMYPLHNWHGLLGLDGVPYAGIDVVDPQFTDIQRDEYIHHFVWINLQTGSHVTIPYRTPGMDFPDWDARVDEKGHLHLVYSISYSANAEKKAQYLQVHPNGTIAVSADLKYGSEHLDIRGVSSIDFTGTKHLVTTLDQNDDVWLLIVDTETGAVVNLDKAVIPFIEIPYELPSMVIYWDLSLSWVVISCLIFLKRKKKNWKT
jgi:hypothetical protein